ncbi:MAG: hypothetical protein WC683_01730 [bacterium]
MPTTQDEKLRTLNHSLGAIENELLHRRLASREADLDDAVDVINDLAAQGHVDICPCEGE